MPDKEFDPWSFSSGLTDAYTGTVEDAYFGFDAGYMNGTRCVLSLEVQTDDPDLGEAGRVRELYPCGEGWEPADKGARLVREDGNAKPLNQQSGVALLVASAVEAGARDYLTRDGGTPFNADIWKGLKADWRRKQFEFKGGDGEKQAYSRMLVEKFLPAKASSGSASGTSGVTKAEPSNEDGAPASTNGELDPKLKIKLKVLAKAVKEAGGNHDTFVERAFVEVDGVMDNKTAEDLVMAAGDSSFFATA